MFVCIVCIYFIEISFLLTDVTRYVTISSPRLGTKQVSNGKLCTLSTLNTHISLGGCCSMSSLCAHEIVMVTLRLIGGSRPNIK